MFGNPFQRQAHFCAFRICPCEDKILDVFQLESKCGSRGEASFRCISESLSPGEIYFPKLWLFQNALASRGINYPHHPPHSQRALLDKILLNLHETFKLQNLSMEKRSNLKLQDLGSTEIVGIGPQSKIMNDNCKGRGSDKNKKKNRNSQQIYNSPQAC